MKSSFAFKVSGTFQWIVIYDAINPSATFAEWWVLKVLPPPLWIQQIQQVSRFIHQSVPLASGLGTVLCRLGGTWLVLGWGVMLPPTELVLVLDTYFHYRFKSKLNISILSPSGSNHSANSWTMARISSSSSNPSIIREILQSTIWETISSVVGGVCFHCLLERGDSIVQAAG